MRSIAVLSVVAVLTSATLVSAQMDVGDLRLEGYGEAGLRVLLQKPLGRDSAKFEEYRDIDQGPYLEALRLRLFRPDEKYSIEISGRDWGLATQEFHLLGERLGEWQVGFDWDQMRRIYSTTARTLATEVKEGVWTLPAVRPTLPTWNDAPRRGDVGVRWDTAHMFVKLTPTPNVDLLAEYTRTHKEGERPTGMAFGGPGGSFLEILEPINQTVHEFTLRGTWAQEAWQLRLGYTGSVFVEEARFLRADNPCNPNPVPADACPAVGATGQFGTSSLPPGNQAHTFDLAAGINLPMRTRINGGFSYSVRLQNENFLQQTYSNGLPGTTPSVSLPANSLDGNVQIAVANVTITSRPLSLPVTFTGKYRLYDHMDFSHQPSFQGYLLNDQNAIISPGGPGVPEPFRSVRESFVRQNADLDARWRFGNSAAVTVGTSWEQWLRGDVREVPRSDEFFAKAAVDVTPNDWLLVRATYLPSFKRIDRYNWNAPREAQNNAPPGETHPATPFAPIPSPLLRKFDQSDRDRQRVDLTAEVRPSDVFAITPAASYRRDTHPDPGFTQGDLLGLRDQTTWSAGIDVSWTPSNRMKFMAGYMHESNFQKMRSRQAPTLGDTSTDWISEMTDTVDTFRASAQATLIPGKLDLTLSGSYAYALGTVDSRKANALPPTIALGADTLPQRWPAYEDTLLRIDGALTYHVTKRISTKLYYVYEGFQYHNWQTDTLNPFLPGVAAIYLGDSPKGYAAQMVGATVRYKFE